jgi:hypothetical protein
MTYLDIKPELGKWYVSEGWRAERFSQQDGIDPAHVAHNQKPSKMIVAGPFDTREQAEAEQLKHDVPGSLVVWPCTTEKQ